MMQAMRNGTPVKAAAVLGLPGTMITSGECDPLVTPTKPRTIRRNLTKTEGKFTTGESHDHTGTPGIL